MKIKKALEVQSQFVFHVTVLVRLGELSVQSKEGFQGIFENYLVV